jgi:hypothetical protein
MLVRLLVQLVLLDLNVLELNSQLHVTSTDILFQVKVNVNSSQLATMQLQAQLLALLAQLEHTVCMEMQLLTLV